MTEPPQGTCDYHHRTPAVASCRLCERDVCGLCLRTVNRTPLCAGCAVGRVDQQAWLAAAFSLVLPGAGQVYNGDFAKAAAVFVLAPLIVPWLWGVYDAAATAHAIAEGTRAASTVPTGGVLLGLKIVWLPVAVGYVVILGLIVSAVLGGLASAFR